jgi:hypothetical protein
VLPDRQRMVREGKTIEFMIALYCHAHHQIDKGLCAECLALLRYAELRLKHCPFQERKATCGNCRIHCYKPAMREKIREVMRFSGPRMIWYHPLLALGHLLDGFRKEPLPAKDSKS